jgi:hypothetical protein
VSLVAIDHVAKFDLRDNYCARFQESWNTMPFPTMANWPLYFVKPKITGLPVRRFTSHKQCECFSTCCDLAGFGFDQTRRYCVVSNEREEFYFQTPIRACYLQKRIHNCSYFNCFLRVGFLGKHLELRVMKRLVKAVVFRSVRSSKFRHQRDQQAGLTSTSKY